MSTNLVLVTASIYQRDFTPPLHSFALPGDIFSALSLEDQVKPLLFPNNFNLKIRSHKFVVFSVFAAHLTSYLNLRSPVYYIIRIC